MDGEQADRQRLLDVYRDTASTYDRWARMADVYRRRSVRLLDLRPGDVVVDVGCGTGLSFAAIERRIGSQGQLLGVDQSVEMLALARRRTAEQGWTNVTLVGAPVEDTELPAPIDAALFFLVPWVLRSPGALGHVLGHLGPGARLAAFAAKWPSKWNLPAYTWVALVQRMFGVTSVDLDQPWRELEGLVDGLTVKSVALGAYFLAWGRYGAPHA